MSKNRPRIKLPGTERLCTGISSGETNSKRSLLLLFFFIPAAVVGLTGLEPVTLRLSSACSNQLSYRPWVAAVPWWRQGDSNP